MNLKDIKLLNNEISILYDEPSCEYFRRFPEWWNNIENYEIETLKIIKKFSNKNKNFIDIGSWYGFMSIYASSFYKNVKSIEGDPVSLIALKGNININKCNNIDIVPFVITKYNGYCNFGGNGKLGNAESSVLINDEKYYSEKKAINDHRFKNKEYVLQDIIKCPCINVNKLVNDLGNDYILNVSLIKIDIEGGELYIIKDIIEQITTNNKEIKLFISLHWIFLNIENIKYCVDLLSNNFLFLYNKNYTKISKKDIIDNKIHDILCSNNDIYYD
jgi:FkbM family methyltransferase